MEEITLQDAEELLLEKARTDGEMHPNGKWIWRSSANGGKGDWRVMKKDNSTNQDDSKNVKSKKNIEDFAISEKELNDLFKTLKIGKNYNKLLSGNNKKGNTFLNELGKINGFSERPHSVKEEIFKKEYAASKNKIFRGVSNKQQVVQFSHGDMFYGQKGIYGAGVYFGISHESDAKGDKAIEFVKNVYANGESDRIIIGFLPNDAKIADYNDLKQELSDSIEGYDLSIDEDLEEKSEKERIKYWNKQSEINKLSNEKFNSEKFGRGFDDNANQMSKDPEYVRLKQEELELKNNYYDAENRLKNYRQSFINEKDVSPISMIKNCFLSKGGGYEGDGILGIYAALKGYDAINIKDPSKTKGSDGVEFLSLLNRSKVKVPTTNFTSLVK